MSDGAMRYIVDECELRKAGERHPDVALPRVVYREADYNALRQQLEQAHTMQNGLKDDVLSLSKQVEQAEAKLAAAEARVKDTQISEMSNVNIRNSIITACQDEITQLRQQLAQVQRELDEAKGHVDCLEQLNTLQNFDKANLQARLTRLEAAVREFIGHFDHIPMATQVVESWHKLKQALAREKEQA